MHERRKRELCRGPSPFPPALFLGIGKYSYFAHDRKTPRRITYFTNGKFYETNAEKIRKTNDLAVERVLMETKEAILSFSQSEKVKSGLIWCSQSIQLIGGLSPEEQKGALKVLQAMIGMISSEAQLALQVSGEAIWLEVDKLINTARVMVDSGVSQESVHHFTQALSQVNRIGQKAMTRLLEKGVLG
jgi:hypothetical protein